MNKEMDTLKDMYNELSKQFMEALRNNRSSAELEILKDQMKNILLKMQEFNLPRESPDHPR